MEQPAKGGLSVTWGSSQSSSEDEENRDTVPPMDESRSRGLMRLTPKAKAKLAKMLSERSSLYDLEGRGYLNENQQSLCEMGVEENTLREFLLKYASRPEAEDVKSVLERHNELRSDNEILKENQVKLHEDNDQLRRNQKLLGCTTALFGTLTIIFTLIASKDTVVGSDSVLSAKSTGRAVVTQSKGVSIVSEIRVDGPGEESEAHECVRMEDVASLYKAFGDGTEARILAGDSSVSPSITRVQGSGASVNETHVTIGDVDFDISAGNPCNSGGRTHPAGPRKLFDEHLRRGLQTGGPPGPGGDEEDVYDAVIIGAGWAGVSAAAQLMSKGVNNILLLEARDYIGGRSRTVTDFVPGAPDVPFELGSEFIYTSYGNNILDIFAGQEASYEAVDFSNAIFDHANVTDGPSSLMDEASSEELYSRLWTNGFFDFLRGSRINIDSSYGALFEDYEAGATLSNSEEQFLEASVNGNIVIEYGGDPEDVAVLGTSKSLGSVSNAGMALTSVSGGGYAKALSGFVEATGIGGKVVTNVWVSDVQHGSEGPVIVQHWNKEGRAASVRARTVLVTAPLGVLKKGSIGFDPELPQAKLDAIDAMEFGVLDKVIMYWDDAAMDGAPDFKAEWDAVASKTWLEVVTPESETSRTWTVFSNTLQYNGLRTLTAWTGGSAALEAEEMDDDAIVDVALGNLRLMFGDDVPSPTKHMITRWGKDPYAGGSYSFRSVGVWFARTARELARSVGDKVFFAGEHTSSGWAGTCAGAFETGRAAAHAMAASLSQDIWASVSRRG